MNIKIMWVILFLSGSAHALVVSTVGRSDLKVALETSKNLFRNRYVGAVKDLESVRAACVDLQKSQVERTKGLKVQFADNAKLVYLQHNLYRQPMQIAILRDHRKRLDQLLRNNHIEAADVENWARAYTKVNTFLGGRSQIQEPQNLRANLLNIFDDFIVLIRMGKYKECSNAVNDIIPTGVQI